MDIKLIQTETEYEMALAEIEALMGATAGSPEEERLDLLATLVEVYESRHHPIEAPDPIELIKFVMEQRGLERADLEPLIGSRSRVSEILSRKRALTLEMIRRLHAALGVPADALIQPYPLRMA